MAFDFPTNPPIDTVYTGVGGYLFTWDGEKWMKGSTSSTGGAAYVLKAGDTMLGFLTANADPVNPMHYATKAYVDLIIGTLGNPGEAHVINPASQPQWGAPDRVGEFLMAIDFPAAPTNGQIFTDAATGKQWMWDGEKWTKGYSEPPAGIQHPPAETIPVEPPIDGADNVNDVLVNFSSDITQLQNDSGQKVAKAGDAEGIMTGYLTLNADPVQPLHAVPKQYIDTRMLPPTTGGIAGQALVLNQLLIPGWGNAIAGGNF